MTNQNADIGIGVSRRMRLIDYNDEEVIFHYSYGIGAVLLTATSPLVGSLHKGLKTYQVNMPPLILRETPVKHLHR